MATPVKGNDIRLYRYDPDYDESILVACARNCEFSVETDERLLTSQDSAWYEESRPDISRWFINGDGLIVLEDFSYLYFLNMQQNRQTLTFQFVIDNGTIDGLVIVSGQAWLKSLKLTGNNKETGLYSFTLKGTGGYSTAGTQITPGGYVINGTTISVLQWQASGDETSHVFNDGIARTMVYGSRGGTAFSPLTYLGTNPTESNSGDWEISAGELRVPVSQPFVTGENTIILVQ
jgi:hypothetical protein